MAFVITLVGSDRPLTAADAAAARDYATREKLAPGDPAWLAPDKAADIYVANKPQREHIMALRAMLVPGRIDLFVTETQNRRKKMLVADMDSTIIRGEMLDELAARAGIGGKISAITARAMAGEIGFEGALRERIALLAGTPQKLLQETLDEAELNPGAQALVKTMTAQGAICVLVSGGFTFFTAPVARRAGFHHHHGNDLGIENGRLTGRVNGDILGKEKKLDILRCRTHEAGIAESDALAIGDGANDLPMLQGAGLGIGYHPKPLLRESLDNCILYGDLTAALYAQGLLPSKLTT